MKVNNLKNNRMVYLNLMMHQNIQICVFPKDIMNSCAFNYIKIFNPDFYRIK